MTKRFQIRSTKRTPVRVQELLLLFVTMLAAPCLLPAQTPGAKREKLLMDFGWRFAFGHPFDAQKDFGTGTGYFSYLAKAGYGDGAAAAGFDDRAWRLLDLPHDWAVEQPFSEKASFSHGFKAVGRNFPAASVGWYRKTFAVPKADLGRRISVVFDGVFRHATVWVNGHYLGTEQSGYAGFRYDVSDLLNYGGNNVIAVRVDATMEEGWYYEGAGIYRHVWLTKTPPVHVVQNGTVVRSVLRQSSATVTAKADVVNEAGEARTVVVEQSVVDADGQTVARGKKVPLRLSPFETKPVTTFLSVVKPKLWDLEAPNLYTLVTTVSNGGNEADRYETPFGIRSIRFDANEGFFLNDRPVKLQGTNNHQDHAGVGTALPDGLQYWRIKTLKKMGVNAYRCAHHPPTPELLDACDKLGMLVVDENRLMRTTEDGLDELKRLIVRDRNHPSVISWSVGNEEWAVENNATGERLATTLQRFVKSLDSTRPTTAGISGGFRSGISDVLEVMGYNYLGNGDINAHRKRFPGQPGMGTEEGSTFATRGIYVTDDNRHYRAAYDQKPRPGFYSIQEGWKFYASRPWLAGMFIWTGFDYRGEPTPYGWPSVTSYFGMLDLCGFPKDNAWYLRSWWTKEPTLHLFPHWNWNGQEGKPIAVWVYSNCDEVELFFNGKSLGRKKMEINGHLEWTVHFLPGTLEAVGYKGGRKILTDTVSTTGEAAALQLAADKTAVAADGEDVAVITVSATDQSNRPVPTADNTVHFSISGPGRIIGMGNGDPTSLEAEKFIDTVLTVAVENLQEKAVEGTDIDVSLFAATDGWKEAFKNRDDSNPAKAYLYRGNFVLPEGYERSKATLFYKNIGRQQSLYVNGNAVAEKRAETETANGFALEKRWLQPGKNEILILATPIPKKHAWDNVNTDPGLIQLTTPAGGWKRKLFSGLAQVIVQTKKEAGTITLKASGPNLASAEVKLVSRAVKSRPAAD